MPDQTPPWYEEYPYAPIIITLQITGDITPERIGPTTSIVWPIYINFIPLSYFFVILLDLLSAFYVRRGLVVDGSWPAPFEMGMVPFPMATRAPTYNASTNNASTYDAPPSDADTTVGLDGNLEGPIDDDPIFPEGVGFNLNISTPFGTFDAVTMTTFSLQILDFPELPVWLIPLFALVIYFYTHRKGGKQPTNF